MKKNYIYPSTKVINHHLINIIATSGASEEQWGGNNGPDPDEAHDEKTPVIGGTGDDTGFTQGSKRRGYFYN